MIGENNSISNINHVPSHSFEQEDIEQALERQTLFEALKIDPINFFWSFWLYFFEFCITASLIDRITQLRHAKDSNDMLEKNMFTICQFLYQVGILISRSSLSCCKLKITGTIATILFGHFTLFFILCI